MGCLLIQLDGRLLWQILSGAKPELLPSLDHLLAILARQTGSLPVQAYLAEAEWVWLRQKIQAHYAFDLAEEILFRLDVICFCCPAPQAFLYAILSDSDAAEAHPAVPLKLSLKEFLAIYQAICQLEEAYAYSASEHADAFDRKTPEIGLATDRFDELIEENLLLTSVFPRVLKSWQGDRSIGKERILLLGLVLMLALLPHLDLVQDWLISPAQAEDDEKTHYFAQLIQTATDWLNQATRQFDHSVAQLKRPTKVSSPVPESTQPIGLFAATELTPLLQPLGEAVLKATDQTGFVEPTAKTAARAVQPELDAIDTHPEGAVFGLEAAQPIEQTVDSTDADRVDSQLAQPSLEILNERSASSKQDKTKSPGHSPLPRQAVPITIPKGTDDLLPQPSDQSPNQPGIADQHSPANAPDISSPDHLTVALATVPTPMLHSSHDALLGLTQLSQTGELSRNDRLLVTEKDQSVLRSQFDRAVISPVIVETGVSPQLPLVAAASPFLPLYNSAQDYPFELGGFLGNLQNVSEA